MLTQSALKNQLMASPLANASVLNPKGKRRKRSMVMTLVLTSLVDAFCMLTIYLMFNISPSGQASAMKTMNLPMATHSDILTSGIIVRVENNRYFINDAEVSKDALVQSLAPYKVSPDTPADRVPQLVIQADRGINFSAFNPIILAGAQNGFTSFKFAVINGGKE
jgi:biopolymer transport protein ExbD